MEIPAEYKKLVHQLEGAQVSETEISVDKSDEKTNIWFNKRIGRITGSNLNKIMTQGKKEPFGKTAITELNLVKYERRTGIRRRSIDAYQFEWGKENEPKAIEWYKKNINPNIKSCSTDFEHIIFNTPFNGFGDSPDFYQYYNTNIVAVGEIKCPIDQAKIEELFDADCDIDEESEYYWQLMGHLLGCPSADVVILMIYDSYTDNARLFTLHRIAHRFNLEKLKQRIIYASTFVDRCLTEKLSIESINSSIYTHLIAC